MGALLRRSFGRDMGAREARQGPGRGSAGYSHAAEPAGKGEREERRVEAMRHASQHAVCRRATQPLDFKRARGPTVATMHAIRLHEFGPADNLRWEEVDDPAPRAGEVLVDVTASGVHLLDTSIRRGTSMGPFPLPDLPAIPGREVAGVVAASARTSTTPGSAAASSRTSARRAAATPSASSPTRRDCTCCPTG